MKSGRAHISIFQKMRKKILMGVSEVRFKKNRLLHLGNFEKPPHPQFLRSGRLRVKFLKKVVQQPYRPEQSNTTVHSIKHFLPDLKNNSYQKHDK